MKTLTTAPIVSKANKVFQALLLTVATLAFTASAHSAGYLKIDDIPGESTAKQQIAPTQGSSAIKLRSAEVKRAPAVYATHSFIKQAVKPTKVNATVKDTSTHRAGDEHEVEYDLVAAK